MSDSESRSTDLFDGWCYSEMMPYSLEQLGTDAWLTGCPLCGASDCGHNVTPEQKAEAAEFFASNEKLSSGTPSAQVPCSACGGTGQDDPPPGKYHGLCPKCGGSGKQNAGIDARPAEQTTKEAR